MSMQTEPRFRICAKESAKGVWQLDATIEYKSDKFTTDNEKDYASNITEPLGLRLLSMVKETEKAFRADKRKMADDADV